MHSKFQVSLSYRVRHYMYQSKISAQNLNLRFWSNKFWVEIWGREAVEGSWEEWREGGLQSGGKDVMHHRRIKVFKKNYIFLTIGEYMFPFQNGKDEGILRKE